MDFEDTKEEADFRAGVRKWLTENAPKHDDSDAGDVLGERGGREWMKAQKDWQAKKAKAGYARITWPKEVGGFGGTPIQQVIFNQEEGKFDVGGDSGFTIALGMRIPAWRDGVRAIQDNEIWGQLFSEPAGGSDVAGLRTRAEKQGDNWIVNGQKI